MRFADFSDSALESSMGIPLICPRDCMIHRKACKGLSDQVLGPPFFATQLLISFIYEVSAYNVL